MRFELVPTELKSLCQWVCWNGNKVPINPTTGRAASVKDRRTWAPYAVAVQAAEQHRGIGFVLTKDDPYTFVDLDYARGDTEAGALQQQVYEYFDSYSEHSPSGKGIHIIVKATCLHARRSHHIEVYDTARYMTMTGNICRNKPIEDRQLHVEQLLARLGTARTDVPIISGLQKDDDETLWWRMYDASNGDAIRGLAEGHWQHRYTSQSRADLALINHLVFYSQCPAQVARMFRASKLGERPKAARDDYVRGMIIRASDQIVPDTFGPIINIRKIRENLIDGSRPLLTPTTPPAPLQSTEFPAGLVGEIAQYIYSSYTRPVPIIALAGAIGLMSGICGRAYNISGQGLNLYTLLLAGTGTGKDAVAQGIGRIRSELVGALPAVADFIGPKLASGQALARHLSDHSTSFVSIFGEFGEDLGRYLALNAMSTDRALVKLMLDLYSKSGHGIHWAGTAYADTTKNTNDVISPSFSFVADATPTSYYGVVSESSIEKGLLPRFLVIEYDGPRVPHRDVPPEQLVLPPGLKQRLLDLCDGALRLMVDNECINIQYNVDAKHYLDAFNVAADARINATRKSVTKHLWSRAHLKSLKLAGALAVGCNQYVPRITIEQAKWATALVEADVLRVIERFDTDDLGHDGDVAVNFEKRVKTVRRCLAAYPEYDPTETSNTNIKPGMQDAGIIPHSTLRRHACAHPAFRKSQHKVPSQLFDEVIRHLIEDEILGKVDPAYLQVTFSHRGVAYRILGS